MKMTITLADLEEKGLSRLEITCDRCPRRGCSTVARLLEQLGRGHDLVRLRLQLAAACPAYCTGQDTPRCGARYPQLPGLFLRPADDGDADRG
jgi:hypothetical protein